MPFQPTAAGLEPWLPADVGVHDKSSRVRSSRVNNTSSTSALKSLVVTRPLSDSHRESPFKLSRDEWFRLLLSIAITAAFVSYLVAVPFLAGKPSDLGLSTVDVAGKQVVDMVVPNGLGYGLGVRPGDTVLDVWELASGGTAMRVALSGGNGPVVEISPQSAQGLGAVQKFSYLVLSIIFIAVGGLVYVKARQRNAASAFYLLCVSSSVALTTILIFYLSYTWVLALMFMSITVWAAAFAIFFLKFPLKVGKTARRHNLFVTSVLLYGFANIAFYLFTLFFSPELYTIAQPSSYAYLAFCTVVGLGSLIRAFFIQRSRLVQNQLSVLLVGTAMAVLPSLLFGVLPKLMGMSGLDVQFTALSLGILPMSMAYAITQHQLLGVRGLVRRGVVYVLMGFAVLLIFGVGALSLGAFLPSGWYTGDFGLLAISLFVFLIALSYGYIQRYVETWVDKFIYHDGYDYKEALLEFSSQLATEQDLSRLATNLVERTCNLMNLTCGVLLLAVHNDDGSETKDRSASGAAAPMEGLLPGELRVVPYARFGAGADWLIEGLQKELAEQGIHLVGSVPTQLMYFNNRPDSSEYGRYNSGILTETLDPRMVSSNGATHNTTSNLIDEQEPRPAAAMPMKSGNRVLRSFLGVPLWTRQRFVGILCLGNKHTGENFTKDDLALLGTLSTQASLAVYNAQLFEAQREALLGTIEALAHAIEAKDGYTIQHCERMTERATALAQAMLLPANEVENIRLAAILHDIGKIGIPDSILNKPARLTPEEYEIMKDHPVIGARIVQSVGALTGVVSIVRHHHERFDGGGYPDKLKGTDIPLGARIITVVDTYGAMTEDRVYRPAPGHDKAVEELALLAGKQFDEEIVSLFIRLLEMRPDLAELPSPLVTSSRLH